MPQHSVRQILELALIANKIPVSAGILEQLLAFLQLLCKWNKVFNLTAITHMPDMIYRHVIDSLIIHPYLYGDSILDLGSGGGFPGIAVAILDPSKSWVLLDKNRKKTQFLMQAVAELELKNVTIYCVKGENFIYPQPFDSIITRAFGSIALFLNTVQHLGNTTSHFFAMKGLYPTEELLHLPPNFMFHKSYTLNINGLAVQRHLISFTKEH